ncbi:single-stranded-DNA-specific exonuclease RecJ [Selenomonas sp. oral taxon 126]|uniref:single-stranded-DNA-specific exonuclease RecJ n=1 Tax=Selenomonas sp. oral taxon 126 TaxID=712528 RepID=UPI00080788D7|nr:single-stranded-DNA-specific exonuclease RecJ [Selenomonas sp. oral taxon 126]ANR71163.1 single-stranded-DNA-specific exonuclease RecJ [Selenomonas sp. oral taxon 126]
MLKEWIVRAETAGGTALARELGTAPIIGQILWNRGLQTAEAARAFLHPEDEPYCDPFLMMDMERAAHRILEAIHVGEQIVVYGDYDVDGMTSTTLLMKNIRALGGMVSYYIPNRFTEGYGLNGAALRQIAAEGCGLLVTVDCGISSADVVAQMDGAMDIIITDHHLPGAVLPPAYAVINPHRADCPYPFKELAGVGVAFKLVQALWQLEEERLYADDLDIVALGTVADLVPLVGENRKLVQAGLLRMTERSSPGIAALVRVSGCEGKAINTGIVGFQLAPRLNAAGRIETARRGVELLTAEDAHAADRIAAELNALNTERRDLEQDILTEAESMLGGFTPDVPAIVVAGEDWNAGVIGIVASRLVEKYYRPSIVLTRQGDVYKGSCRSIAGLHMYDALAACRDTLIQFGGHAMAAGLTLECNRLEDFRCAFANYVNTHLNYEDFTPKISIEALVAPADWTIPMVEEIALLEPYGMGNPRPIFGVRDVRPRTATAIGADGKHLRMEVGTREKRVAALYWNYGELAELVTEEASDLAYTPSINEWQGMRSVQCMADSIMPAAHERIFPDRGILKAVYAFLRELGGADGHIPYSTVALTRRFSRKMGHISRYTMDCALCIFRELGLLVPREQGGWHFIPPEGRLELMDAPTFRRHEERKGDM